MHRRNFFLSVVDGRKLQIWHYRSFQCCWANLTLLRNFASLAHSSMFYKASVSHVTIQLLHCSHAVNMLLCRFLSFFFLLSKRFFSLLVSFVISHSCFCYIYTEAIYASIWSTWFTVRPTWLFQYVNTWWFSLNILAEWKTKPTKEQMNSSRVNNLWEQDTPSPCLEPSIRQEKFWYNTWIFAYII